MRKMKESGIDWIGAIPEDWDIIRFKRIHNCMNTGESIDKNFWTTESDGTVFYTAGSVPIKTTFKDFPIWKITKENDLLLARNGTPYVYLPVKEAFYTDHIIRASLKEGINRKYVRYSLQQSISSVVVETVSIPTWSASIWNSQELPWPSIEYQNKIVAFLDDKCDKIDSVIKKQQLVIEKLNAYKMSIITETVTKGLSAERNMKSSGSEFIGEVPEEWQILKFGRCVTIKSNLVPPEDYGDYPQISPEHIEKNSGRLFDTYTTVKESGVISGNHLFFKGQIIYSKIRPMLNKVTIAPFDGLCSADMYPIETGNHTKFILYMMLSDYFTAQVGLVTENRVKMPKINQNELSNITVALPPLDEQKQIADYLDKKCAAIDASIAKRQQLIEKLTEYKKSLIFEVVTGKKEV